MIIIGDEIMQMDCFMDILSELIVLHGRVVDYMRNDPNFMVGSALNSTVEVIKRYRHLETKLGAVGFNLEIFLDLMQAHYPVGAGKNA